MYLTDRFSVLVTLHVPAGAFAVTGKVEAAVDSHQSSTEVTPQYGIAYCTVRSSVDADPLDYSSLSVQPGVAMPAGGDVRIASDGSLYLQALTSSDASFDLTLECTNAGQEDAHVEDARLQAIQVTSVTHE
jgi:hypothetical protein